MSDDTQQPKQPENNMNGILAAVTVIGKLLEIPNISRMFFFIPLATLGLPMLIIAIGFGYFVYSSARFNEITSAQLSALTAVMIEMKSTLSNSNSSMDAKLDLLISQKQSEANK